jgi:hypothetical protein
MSPTFNGISIGNHDLKIIDDIDATIDLFSNATMNKIMGSKTGHKDDDFPIFNVTN